MAKRLTGFAKGPAAPVGGINGHRVDETRDEVTGRQVHDQHIGRRPQPLESALNKIVVDERELKQLRINGRLGERGRADLAKT